MTGRTLAGALCALLLGTAAGSPARAQVRDTVVRGEMPKLEIPEITIVGKKAITLPFARKGEIYDVPFHEAPPPDTGLLAERPLVALPGGSLPRYEQRTMPWRIAVEGSAGRHATLGLRGYVDYHTRRWTLSTTGGFRRTGGHVPNSAGDEFDVGGRYTALVGTDNDILRDFRVVGDLELRTDAFGMPGLPGPAAERDRRRVLFGAGFSSLKRQGLVLDFSVGADIFSVDDAAGGTDSNATVTSPSIEASVTGDAGPYRIITGFRFASSSLDYAGGAPSPSLYTLTGAVQWTVARGFFLRAGAVYSAGSGTDDVQRSRFSPTAELEWEAGEGRKIGLWFRPVMSLASYAGLASAIPYLAREVALIPEDRTVDFGGTLWYNSGMLALEVTGGYSRSDNRPLIVTDSGRIRTSHAGTWQSLLGAEGTLRPAGRYVFRFTAKLQPSRERGGGSQLPMVPLVEAGAQAEVAIAPLWAATAGARAWSRRNTDRGGSSSIGGALAADAGLSTGVIPRVLLSVDARNLFGRRYDWWPGYPARGLDILVTVKARL